MQHTFQTPASKSFSEKEDDSKAPCRLRPRLHARGKCVPEQENNLENPLHQLYPLFVFYKQEGGMGQTKAAEGKNENEVGNILFPLHI